MKVYFHSDDVCLSSESTKQILRCWSEGFLDGFSILANKQFLYAVGKKLEENRSAAARVSVHLNLTDLKSCLPSGEIPLLVTDTGNFRVSFLRALLIVSTGGERKRKFLAQVYKEWDAQIELVKKVITSHEVSGLDSHNHLHMIPSLFHIVSQLADKHQINRVRVPVEPFYISSYHDLVKWFYIKNLTKWFVVRWLNFFSNAHQSAKMQTAMGILYSGNMFQKNVAKGLKVAREKMVESVEVIFHVGRSDEAALENNIASESSIRFFTSAKREKEYHAVQNLIYERKGADHNY